MLTMQSKIQIRECEEYLNARTGNYGYRRIRYMQTLIKMMERGLCDEDVIIDVGAGRTEFDFCARVDAEWRGMYIPIDGCIDGVDLETWECPRRADFFVALEIIEHLESPMRLLNEMISNCTKAVLISTPNPETTDVLGMDRTHKTPVSSDLLRAAGFSVMQASFYGQPNDSLFGVWEPSS